LEDLCCKSVGYLLLAGDFNFRDIDSESYTSTLNCDASKTFIKVIQNCLLTHHVSQARGTNVPSLLDLVFTNDLFVAEVHYLAPLGKSDQAVIKVCCKFESEYTAHTPSYNFNRGDYGRLCEFLDIDWNSVIGQCGTIEAAWQCFKSHLALRY
jgi:hypothetical protein